MINVAILTGRGGSSLKDKNLKKFYGKPICAYPCIAAKKSNVFSHFFCSSDSNKILETAASYGFLKIKRPKKLSTSKSLHIDVINHALKKINSLKIYPDTITVLMANTATITPEILIKSLNLLKKNNELDSVVPVILEQDHHPLRAKRIDKFGNLQSYFNLKDKVSSNRQDLPNNFYLTHSFWSIKITNNKIKYGKAVSPWYFLGNKSKPIIVKNSIDIHDIDDFKKTEIWLKKNINKFKI